MKLLAIVGSPRLNGNTDYLTGQALEEAARLGVETEKIILSQHKVEPCLGHDDCASFDTCVLKDDAAWILESLCEADGVILATPVYYYNASAQMKAFIDRNYFLYTPRPEGQSESHRHPAGGRGGRARGYPAHPEEIHRGVLHGR